MTVLWVVAEGVIGLVNGGVVGYLIPKLLTLKTDRRMLELEYQIKNKELEDDRWRIEVTVNNVMLSPAVSFCFPQYTGHCEHSSIWVDTGQRVNIKTSATTELEITALS